MINYTRVTGLSRANREVTRQMEDSHLRLYTGHKTFRYSHRCNAYAPSQDEIARDDLPKQATQCTDSSSPKTMSS